MLITIFLELDVKSCKSWWTCNYTFSARYKLIHTSPRHHCQMLIWGTTITNMNIAQFRHKAQPQTFWFENLYKENSNLQAMGASNFIVHGWKSQGIPTIYIWRKLTISSAMPFSLGRFSPWGDGQLLHLLYSDSEKGCTVHEFCPGTYKTKLWRWGVRDKARMYFPKVSTQYLLITEVMMYRGPTYPIPSSTWNPIPIPITQLLKLAGPFFGGSFLAFFFWK